MTTICPLSPINEAKARLENACSSAFVASVAFSCINVIAAKIFKYDPLAATFFTITTCISHQFLHLIDHQITRKEHKVHSFEH